MFKYYIYAKISNKKQIKSQKIALMNNRKRYFVKYKSKSIY